MVLRRLSASCLTALLPLLPATAGAEGLAIDHEAVGCAVAGEYPRFDACFTPPHDVARGRVYFRRQGAPSWYYVEMAPAEACYTGALPKPKKELAGERIEYYVEATDKGFHETRTEIHQVLVAAGAAACAGLPLAKIAKAAPLAVFPGMPAGFTAGGGSTAAVVGIAAGGAAAAGAAVAISGGGGDTATTTTTTAAAPTTTMTAPAPTTTTTTTTLPSANRPPAAVFKVNPDPPQGRSPFLVKFNMCGTEDPDGDALHFSYDFGEGEPVGSGQCRDEHEYRVDSPQTFRAETCVTDRNPGHELCMQWDVAVEPEFVPVSPVPAAGGPAWTSQLDVPGSRAQVVVNGRRARFLRTGRSRIVGMATAGPNRVEAQLVDAAGQPGNWRFDLAPDGIAPGSLRVIAGEVTLLSETAIVFRLAGRPGERVVFAFQGR